MTRRRAVSGFIGLMLVVLWSAADAQPRAFSVNYTSRATRVTAKFNTTFTNHGMTIPQL